MSRDAALPDWLPPLVRSHVLLVEKLLAEKLINEKHLDGLKSDLAILHRLATDPRMRYVWRELAHCEATDKALVEFFDCAFQRARLPYFVTTPRDRAAQAAPWSSAAELCRWSHEHGIAARMDPELSAALVRVAYYFEEIARREGNTDLPLVVKHHSGAAVLAPEQLADHLDLALDGRAYVRVLGGLTRKLFGSPLYGTVARTASVALQQDIDWQQVREWLKP